MLVHRPDAGFVAGKLKEIVRENIDVDQHQLEMSDAVAPTSSYDSPVATKETSVVEPTTATSEDQQPAVQQQESSLVAPRSIFDRVAIAQSQVQVSPKFAV